MTTTQAVDSRMTLDEITNAHPQTIEVFNRFGLDVCCGGGLALADAVARDGMDLNAVLVALGRAITRGPERTAR